MKQIIIFGIVTLSIVLAFYTNGYLQQKLRPRTSGRRLLLYIAACLIVVFAITFFMVFIILRLFPGELIK